MLMQSGLWKRLISIITVQALEDVGIIEKLKQIKPAMFDDAPQKK